MTHPCTELLVPGTLQLIKVLPGLGFEPIPITTFPALVSATTGPPPRWAYASTLTCQITNKLCAILLILMYIILLGPIEQISISCCLSVSMYSVKAVHSDCDVHWNREEPSRNSYQ